MKAHLLQTQQEFENYNRWITSHPDGSLWQSLEWKEYQEALGREVRVYALMGKEGICATALVSVDRTSFGLSTWEIARGPIYDNRQPTTDNQFLDQIILDAKKDKCFAFYYSPTSNVKTKNEKRKTSKRHVVPEATLIINLRQTEEEVLAQMKPKGRYNIKVAQKHGVAVQQSTDIDAFHRLLLETSKRDTFKPLPKSHYKMFFESLEGSFLFLAIHPHQKKPIAGLLGVVWPPDDTNDQENQQNLSKGLPTEAEGLLKKDNKIRLRQGFGVQSSAKVGVYYYGASSYAHRASMAPYLLQWEAMRFCKERGCKSYDLFGIAPPDKRADARHKCHPDGSGKTHPWHGVTAFKEKFGGEVVLYPEEKMIVLRPVVNVVLQAKRKLFT